MCRITRKGRDHEFIFKCGSQQYCYYHKFKIGMQSRKEKGAVPFIIKNEHTNCYELTKQAEDLLKKVDKNISVVSVAGLYRTGKSYLLNSVILDKKSIFGVGPTVNPCTKGLWMWVEPDPISEKRSMLVIDTEGLGALDEEANHDMKIFCLAVLLSTTFIYNSVGSIDENALQSLSLVLNLVSTIDQQNSSNRPQFIWVVRDFSLQLIDDKGKTLTPHQYLEMALTSNTKQQQKATIRKTITSAFSQRDCYTLVKPLIDENKLQNLDQVPMDELRPEFVSQSIELRNKIKSTLKQFKLTSSQNNITGKQYVMVVQKYLTAINSGAVPNMVDTWTFIKEQKCREALQQITRIYTEKIKLKIISKIPMKRAHIDDQFKAMKTQMKALFLKLTYGQSSTEVIDEFISNVYTQAVKLNSEETRLWMKSVLNKQFEPFLKKLYSQQYYNNFDEFEAEVSKNYKEALLEKLADKVDDVKEQVERYVDQKLVENFKFFEKKLKEDVKNMKAIKDQLESSLNRQISQITSIKQRDRRSHQEKIFELQKKIRGYENEKQQIMEFGRAEKDLIESNINLLKKKNQQLISANDELNRQIKQLHVTQNQLKEKNFMEHKQNQKQRALFAQKEEYMSTKIKELEQKCGDFQGRLTDVGGKLQSQKKDLSRHFQSKIQTLETENKRISQKLMQTQSKLGKILDEARDLSDQMQNLKQNNVTQKKRFEQKLIEIQSNKKPSKIEHDLKQQNHELIMENQKMGERVQDLNKRIKNLQDEMKNMQNNGQKQIAIHVQQIQFQQIQIADLKNRYEEVKKSYQHTLENLHDSSKSQQNSMQLKMYELTTEHQKQMKNIEIEYEEKLKSCKKQIQMLTRHKEEMALQQSLDKKNLQSKEKEWKQSTSMLHLMVKKLEQKIQSSEKDHEDINKEKQSFYSIRIKQLEQEVDEVKQKTSQELADNAKKSEEAIAVLKHYSEIEKQQWEKRLSDQKDRSEKRIKSLKDQHEKKLNEERANLEEQISDLQSRLVHLERVFNEKLQNMQYDHGIAMQKITNQYMEEKVQLNKELALTQQKLEMTKASFEKELSNKIKYYETTLENTKASLRQEFEENIKRLTEQKEVLEQKFDATKKANRQLEQSNLLLKSQSDKQRAVHKQKQKSLEKKIVQIENRLQFQLSNYNKTIEAINERHAVEIEKLNEQIDKLNYSVSSLQEERDKLETEHENNISRLQAKLKVVEESKNKNKQDYEDIVSKFQNAVSHFGTQKKKIILEKEKGMEEMTEKTSIVIKQIEQSHAKMIKQHEDRIARLATQNKSLKERMIVMELERSTPVAKKTYMEESEKQKIDRKHEKYISEYKQLYEKQKEKSRKLKQQNTRLRMENQGSSFIQGTSTMTYERPSFSEVSNSRLYNAPSNTTMFNPTEVKRKYTNTPSGTQRSNGGLEQYSGFLRFNAGTGYKNRD